MKQQRNILRAVVMLGISCLFVFTRALPCSCTPPKPPADEYAQRSAVFIGIVRSIEYDSTRGFQSSIRVTFEITKAWKGVPPNTVVIYTAENSAACGYSFIKDTAYVVYAIRLDTLVTSSCTRTKKVSTAAEDLSYLNQIVVQHVPERTALTDALELHSYPNPANPSTTIRFTLPQRTTVSISLFSLCGKEVQTLFSGTCEAGVNELAINLSALPSGLYFTSLYTPFGNKTSKLVLLK
jgi:hypothetical protein